MARRGVSARYEKERTVYINTTPRAQGSSRLSRGPAGPCSQSWLGLLRGSSFPSFPLQSRILLATPTGRLLP